MGLMKDARGLPKFMLDSGFWRALSWRGATPEEVGLFAACVSYCYEHETDGHLGPLDDLAVALGFKERDTLRPAGKLLKRGTLAQDERGVYIVDFLDHNPSRDDIRGRKRKQSDGGALGNHKRWHKNTPDPLCDFCTDSLDRSGERSEDGSVPGIAMKTNGMDVIPPTPQGGDAELERDDKGRLYVVPGRVVS